MEELPNEILLAIVNQLPMSSQSSVSKVNKTLRQLAYLEVTTDTNDDRTRIIWWKGTENNKYKLRIITKEQGYYEESWYDNKSRLHSYDDMPAHIVYNENNIMGVKHIYKGWYHHGLRHRTNGFSGCNLDIGIDSWSLQLGWDLNDVTVADYTVGSNTIAVTRRGNFKHQLIIADQTKWNEYFKEQFDQLYAITLLGKTIDIVH